MDEQSGELKKGRNDR